MFSDYIGFRRIHVLILLKIKLEALLNYILKKHTLILFTCDPRFKMYFKLAIIILYLGLNLP